MELCFIGAGNHATTNIFPAAVAANIGIQAVATRHVETARAALGRFGSAGRAYGDYCAMLEREDCPGVVVVAQPEAALEITLDCVRAKKNVFVDKPLGWNKAQAATVAELAAQNGVGVMVGFMKRYAPAYRSIKRLLDSGELGAPRSFQVFFGAATAAFCKTREEYLKLAAIHIVDLVRFLFGDAAGLRGFAAPDGPEVHLALALRFKNGVVGNANFVGASAWGREHEQLLISCERGFIETADLVSLRVHKSQPPDMFGLAEQDTLLSPSHSPMSGGLRDLHLRGFVGELAHFADCIKTRRPPNSSAQDNVWTMALCDEILRGVE